MYRYIEGDAFTNKALYEALGKAKILSSNYADYDGLRMAAD